MAKSKKTKIHKKIDGQLLQMNKSFSNLKMKQKEKITTWVYEEYKKYVTENERVPDSEADAHIIDKVLDMIDEAQIWISAGEIASYYYRKKPQLQKRLDNEEVIKFKSYVSFYKSFAGESVPVNQKLSDMLLQLHISERTGRGVPKITEVYGKETYEFRENLIVVSIPFTRVQMEENTQVDLEMTYDNTKITYDNVIMTTSPTIQLKYLRTCGRL